MKKQNLILADCEKEEMVTFAEGLEEILHQKFEIKNKVCNGKHNKINNIYRYIIYFIYPFISFLNRKKYNYIIGWQQFFALFYCFYCNLFKVKKENIVVVCNFTYKEKKRFIGKIYRTIMQFCIKNDYLDYIHVPSKKYAEKCSNDFDIPIEKFIVINFGLPDTYEKWKNTTVEYDNYSLAIGRSNRDYDFLIEVWKKIPKENKLIIICDQYKSRQQLPKNIILRNDITGDKQYPYIMNCKMMIIPIKDKNICSGDTVLLKAMSFYKTVVVTEPSTLSEMYIKNNENGVCILKNVNDFVTTIIKLLENDNELKRIGKIARQSFIDNYSRKIMGINIGKIIQ